ncbi:MAG TPA: DUF2283 domain-containing protein [Bryobacteraceae bacterium]|jgi:uncharacterized protein YuzE|nr:DUF2283 domain-containing protein [Bryobacteraceae bacterium]
MRVARSANGIPIRLTDGRWLHVTEEHSELAGYFFDVIETIETPESVVEGAAGELLALQVLGSGLQGDCAQRRIRHHGLSNKTNPAAGATEENMAELNLQSIVDLAPQLAGIPYRTIWSSYDAEADVLYLNFKKPSHADDTELTDDDILIRYEKGEVVGVTVLHASRRRTVASRA